MVLFVGLFVLVIVVFAILFRRQKRNLKYSTSQKDPESQVNIANSFLIRYNYTLILLLQASVKAKAQKSVVTSSPPPFIKRTTSIRRYRNMLEVPKDNVQLRDYLCDGTYFDLRKGLITLPDNENRTHEVMIKKAKG